MVAGLDVPARAEAHLDGDVPAVEPEVAGRRAAERALLGRVARRLGDAAGGHQVRRGRDEPPEQQSGQRGCEHAPGHAEPRAAQEQPDSETDDDDGPQPQGPRDQLVVPGPALNDEHGGAGRHEEYSYAQEPPIEHGVVPPDRWVSIPETYDRRKPRTSRTAGVFAVGVAPVRAVWPPCIAALHCRPAVPSYNHVIGSHTGEERCSRPRDPPAS